MVSLLVNSKPTGAIQTIGKEKTYHYQGVGTQDELRRSKSILLIKKELRAVRNAGQKPGDIRSIIFNKIREVIAMAKQLIFKAGFIKDSTLVILGWLTFVVSFFIPNIAGVIALQSVARVLP